MARPRHILMRMITIMHMTTIITGMARQVFLFPA
jgi:hypothetical protein